MKKIIVIVGGFIALLGVFIGLLDKTLGFWQLTYTYPILFGTDTITYYLTPFGNILNSENTDVTVLADSGIMVIIAILILVGAIGVIVGGFMDKPIFAIIGAVLMGCGIGYFFYTIGNFVEIQDLLTNADVSNYLFGNDTYTWMSATWTWQWRLGTGFFIVVVGGITTIVGSSLKR